jgi:hypothetical protein
MKSPLFIVFALFGAVFLLLSLTLTVVAESAKLVRRAYGYVSMLSPGAVGAAAVGVLVTSVCQYYWVVSL